MMSMLISYRYTVLLPSLLILVTGCAQSVVNSSQEYLEMGIVSCTLGEQQRVAQCVGEPSSVSVVGQVQALEGGAYLIRDVQGQEIRIPMMKTRGSIARPMSATAFNPGSITKAAPC